MGQSCQIVGLLGILVQLSLGVLSFSVLILKRWRQKPRRPWKIWALDTSKQVISQLFAHFVNLSISVTLSVSEEHSDACLWYLITNILDNSFGVLVCVLSLKIINRILTKCDKKQYISGNYYTKVNPQHQHQSNIDHIINQQNHQQLNQQLIDSHQQNQQEKQNGESNKQQQRQRKSIIIEQANNQQQNIQNQQNQQQDIIYIIDYKAWLIQLVIWNIIVAMTKTFIFAIQFGLKSPIQQISGLLFGWIQQFPALQLVLVIVIVPVLLNGFAFWVQDNFLMKKQSEEDEKQKQALLENSKVEQTNKIDAQKQMVEIQMQMQKPIKQFHEGPMV